MSNQGVYVLDGGKFDPMGSQRIAAAWDHIAMTLKDGGWHSWSYIVAEGVALSGLAPKTVSNLLHRGVTSGYFERGGDYREGTRRVRQVRWP